MAEFHESEDGLHGGFKLTGLPEIDYQVRRSKRARNARLTLRPGDGLVVVIPANFDERLIPGLIEAHRPWITRQTNRLGDLVSKRFSPPTTVELAGCNERWNIEYVAKDSATIRINATANKLRLTGNISDEQQTKAALRRWLKKHARPRLMNELEKLAKKHGFKYSKVSIRHQRTRWGSCSSRGMISLNAALLLLPDRLVKHVLLHELCHTVHLDHGAGFWKLLASLEPDHQLHRMELRDHWRQLPVWAT
ncbi:MAG: M48 family metallopeptidase [Gammaproteobacteria bacterium]|nr:M48 family metallopeptidase [Gammaproteobacteria bacterium]